jgi:hypothetical protein
MQLKHWREGFQFGVIHDPKQVLPTGSVVVLYDVIGEHASAEIDGSDYVDLNVHDFLSVDGEVLDDSVLGRWCGSVGLGIRLMQ